MGFRKPLFVPLSLTQGEGASGIFLVGVVLCNWAVEHNVATFSESSLSAMLVEKAKQRLLLRVTMLI